MSDLVVVEGLAKSFSLSGGAMSFGRRPRSVLHAVDRVSFSVKPGEAIGLVGESGSGKSTLVDMLAKLSVPSAGRIVFDGQDISGISPGAFAASPLRRRIQVVFQDAGESWNPRFTAYQAVAHPLKRLLGLRGDELRAKIEHVVQAVGFPAELLGRYPHQLSGGQRARVGIARALAVEPDLLILDEPTSALDTSVQAVVLRLLDDLRRRFGITYIFVSHDLNVVRLLCDRILVMYLGRIVEEGATDAVFVSPGHPYTARLIEAIAGRRDRSAGGPQRSGETASPFDRVADACCYFGRCERGSPRPCSESRPELRSDGRESAAACFFPLPGLSKE